MGGRWCWCVIVWDCREGGRGVGWGEAGVSVGGSMRRSMRCFTCFACRGRGEVGVSVGEGAMGANVGGPDVVQRETGGKWESVWEAGGGI